MAKKRKSYTASEKAKIAFEALKGELTLNELTAKYGVHATQINRWKRDLKEGMASIFIKKPDKEQSEALALTDELYKQIGQLKVELDWLKKKSELFN